MTHIAITLIFLGFAIILQVATKEIIDKNLDAFDTDIKAQISQFQNTVFNVISRMEKFEESNQKLREHNQILEENCQMLEEKNHILEETTKNLEKRNKIMDGKLEHFEMELSKLDVLKTCEEMAEHSVDKSADPIIFSAYKTSGSDIGLFGQEYIQSYGYFLTDYGHSFDLHRGIFTAPRAGVYEFSTVADKHSYTPGEGRSRISVEKNDVTELEFSSYQEPLSFNWMMELEQGETVRLKVTSGPFECSSDSVCIFNGKYSGIVGNGANGGIAPLVFWNLLFILLNSVLT